ncbi:ABC transporter permease [Paenibacillus tritici]|uniref:ABC transporter permease n=1 Tax=Paenibacillus tritici TaxID=1873425 RepID=UPI001BA6D9EA|nr:ABC transporter permease [Paenibacillus tritici]QUL57214.1 ABC transporter permease [Paenibacillus tritici]
MYYRIIRNDIRKSKATTLTTMLFVAAAAMLVSLSAILIVNLTGAIDNLMTQAKTPHFLQMHSGQLDKTRLSAFAEQNRKVEEFQVLDFLNVENAQIVIDGQSLADSVQDNGFSTQSGAFDYLLDLDGKVITVQDGEIYVPVTYMKDGSAKAGSSVRVGDKSFSVAGFLRDSQMNSLLASSKRFLISPGDYAEIQHSGSTEYLIEFRLKDLSTLGAFETEYTAAGLEGNGPVITYPLFRVLNAISDGLMIAVILMASVLVVIIAFLCIRFTLLATMESDYREIGVMKAIGLRVSDLKRLYLAKYAAVAALGSILGLALSFVFKGLLLDNIRLYMGESGNPALALACGILGVLLVFLTIVAYVNRVLKRFHWISAVEAIRFGTAQEKPAGSGRLTLSGNRLLNTNVYLGLKDVLSRKGLYATMLAVLVISSFIMIVPQNLYTTISSPSFITYMGIGDSDLRLDIQQTGNIEEKTTAIARVMESDVMIFRHAVLTTRALKVKLDDGTEERLKVEFGDHSIFPVAYSEGRRPEAANEIALSAVNAKELRTKPGDSLTLLVDGEPRALAVSGIYSDVTNGGKTAKAVFPVNSAEVMWSVIYAELADSSLVSSKVTEYAELFNYAKVSGIDEYVTQTFGSTISSVGKAAWASMALMLLINVLITLLFMRMLVAKDRYSIAVMKSLGFRNSELTAQYYARSVVVLIIGVVLGTLLANTLGQLLAGAVISSFGASSFKFVVDPLSAYVLCPLIMTGSVFIATIIGTSGIGRIQISGNIKE